jgi:predicted nucleic acid-binding protein
VINEVANTLFRKTSLDENQIYKIIEQILDLVNVVPLTSEITVMAIAIKGRYGFSFYDSLIIAAALMAKCNFLLTEDLQEQQRITLNSETIQVINPFLDEE